MAGKPSKKKKHLGITLIFWLVFACVVIIIFLAKKDSMLSVMKETDFFGHVFGKEPTFITEHQITEDVVVSENTTASEEMPTENATISISEKGTPVLEFSVVDSETTKNEVFSESEKTIEKTQAPSKTVVEKAPEVNSTSTMNLHVWFVVIDGDGTIVRKEAVRLLPKTGTPLADSIKNLLVGPNFEEREKGFTSLIPSGTQLLDAAVRNKVATLSFNDNFMYNTYGVEGYLGQLMQIVYTATAFPTIDSVQFLINGEKLEFLGEGVRIGSPLTRASFK